LHDRQFAFWKLRQRPIYKRVEVTIAWRRVRQCLEHLLGELKRPTLGCIEQQRTFRELQEGLLEAERIRAATGRWPDVAALADEGIPPFAPDPTRKGPSYKWTSVRQDWATNYVGVPSDPSAPAWTLVILEPAPGEPPDPAPNDETHHRLPDGTTLHVTIWTIPEQSRRSGFAALRLPQNEGWTQLMVGGAGSGQ